jgi:uncharacterized protein (DUF2267 family)
MPAYENLPGTVPPDGLETRNEWVPPGEGFLPALAARLGSETDASKVVLAVLAPLRPFVDRDSWEAIREELPWGLRGVLATPEAHLGRIPRIEDAAGLVAYVGVKTQHPDDRAALYVAATFATLRQTLPAGLADAIAGELPGELGALWRMAR